MPPIVSAHGFTLDLDDLYTRMWEVGVEDRGDGTRLYRPAPHQALKWLIADLAGTPAERGKTLPANNAIREQVHHLLEEGGWAERLSQTTFRLLRRPVARQAGEQPTLEQLVTQDLDDEGQVIDEVPVEVVTVDHRVTLGELPWSEWKPLPEAARVATTQPGVYLARMDGQIVYVGMAGERRGRGVRGRLVVYARGRGAVSGLGEAALDRALADDTWLAARLQDLRTAGPSRAQEWAAAALARRPLDVSWVAADSAEQARSWERQVLTELTDADLWNRQRP